MLVSDGKPAHPARRENFTIVSTKFLGALSRSDLSPTELSLLFYLLSQMRLGGNVVPKFSGIEAAAATGRHETSVSTALTRLRQRQIVRRDRVGGHVVITINPNLASRADKRSRAILRTESGMPQVAITRLSSRG